MGNLALSLSGAISFQKSDLAKLIVDEQWGRNPGFHTRYGEAGHAKCVHDVEYNLSYLSEAIAFESPALFAEYIDWVKVLFAGLKIPTSELAESLQITDNRLQERFPDAADIVHEFVDLGLNRLVNAPEVLPSLIDDANPLSGLARKYLDALRRGERSESSRLILNSVENGVSVRDVYLHVFQPTQQEIGRLWQMNKMSVAEEHYCTAATQLIMSQLYSRIFSTEKIGRCLVATCVGNELHEIGLRMVADFFEMDGWDTYYLGSDAPASSIVQALKDRRADVLAISATMTFHVGHVSELIAQVRAADTGGKVKILAGGYPFNIDPELWRHVGADGSASGAESAVAVASSLMAA